MKDYEVSGPRTEYGGLGVGQHGWKARLRLKMTPSRSGCLSPLLRGVKRRHGRAISAGTAPAEEYFQLPELARDGAVPRSGSVFLKYEWDPDVLGEGREGEERV